MSVPQFTTPTFTFTFDEENLDLTEASNVYVTFRSRNYSVTKTGSDLTIGPKQIDVFLSQNETSRFSVGEIEIQVNWTLPNNRRASSEVVVYDISKQLLQKVIE